MTMTAQTLMLRPCPLCDGPDLLLLDDAGWVTCSTCGPQPRTRAAGLAAARAALSKPKQPTPERHP